MLPSLARRYVSSPVQRVLASAFPAAMLQSTLSQEADGLRLAIAAATPGNPAAAGYQTYSQTDEDGILEDIFARIGEGQRTFAEMGCGDGRQNNTHLLLLKGWRGMWIDGDPKRIEFIAGHFPLATSRLSVLEAFVTRENVVELVTRGLSRVGGEIGALDLFSLDLDGNDLEILSALLGAGEPRVLCLEYNAKFRLPVELSVSYDPAHVWAEDDYHGASLGAILRRISDRYTLVCCNIAGVNAFFVRNDLADPFSPYPAEALYQPPRHHLALMTSGHAASLKFLAASLRGETPQRG
jgi:hypothetical protein